MYTSANLVDDFILIDELATGDEVLFDLGFVSSRRQKLVMGMTYGSERSQGWEGNWQRREN